MSCTVGKSRCELDHLEALKEAWQIINVLTLSHLDEGEPYPKALFWLKDWEHLGYPQPNPKLD